MMSQLMNKLDLDKRGRKIDLMEDVLYSGKGNRKKNFSFAIKD